MEAQESGNILIHELSEIPTFSSEAEEIAYWNSHRIAPDLLEKMTPLSEEETRRLFPRDQKYQNERGS